MMVLNGFPKNTELGDDEEMTEEEAREISEAYRQLIGFPPSWIKMKYEAR